MTYRELGKSGIELSAITTGAWAIGGFMWGGSDEKQSIDAIHHGYALGVTTIITAPIYGMGLSEELVGKVVNGQRNDYEILTKFGIKWKQGGSQAEYNRLMKQIYWSARKESILRECEESLKRLDADYIDFYQHHIPAKGTDIDEVMETLDRLKDQGKIRAAGVSNYSLDQFQEAEKYLQIEANQ